jgi:AraC family transcriptional activator of pyochelin receptor
VDGLRLEGSTINKTENHWLLYKNKRYSMYSAQDSMNSFSFTNEFGSGHVKQLLTSPFAQVKETEMTLCETLCGGVDFGMPRMVLYFCLAGEFAFEEKDLILAPSHFIAFNAADLRRVVFPANLHHRVITLEIYPDKLQGVSSGALSIAMGRLLTLNKNFSTHKLSSVMKTVLHQLLHCPYHDSLRIIYMESKLLELMVMYLNEVIYQQETVQESYSNLSRQDVKCIYQAKQILDQSFVSSPTLAALSKMICLNEFKLKNGFKQLFGQTVHAYIVTKRLELAKQLFEEKKLNVGEVASHIGYANASYFALAFRKKFGVAPSEYLQAQKE